MTQEENVIDVGVEKSDGNAESLGYVGYVGKEREEREGKVEVKSAESEGKEVYSHALASAKVGEIVRDERGRWLPGHAPKPPAPRRKPKEEEKALLAALSEALPASDVPGHIEQCIKWAYEYKSPKLLMEILKFKYDRVIGTPVQRSLSASGKLETLLDMVSNLDDDKFDRVEEGLRSNG